MGAEKEPVPTPVLEDFLQRFPAIEDENVTIPMVEPPMVEPLPVDDDDDESDSRSLCLEETPLKEEYFSPTSAPRRRWASCTDGDSLCGSLALAGDVFTDDEE